MDETMQLFCLFMSAICFLAMVAYGLSGPHRY